MQLRDYQRSGAAWLRSRNGVLAWEPGVGKTFTALEGARRVGGRSLYVCPANLRDQVADAAGAFDPSLTVQVLSKAKDAVSPAADMVVASYNAVSDKGLWKRLFALQWGALICDEGHALKSPDAARTRAIYGARTNSNGALFRRARFTWPLTGTPVLNDPSELWTHYSRLFPFAIVNDEGDPLTRAEWVDRFCHVRNDGFGDKIVGGKNLDELRAVLGPWVNWLSSDAVLGLEAPTIDTLTLTADKLPNVPAHAADAVRMVLDKGEPLEGLQEALATERRLIGVAKAEAVARQVLTELEGGREKIVVFAHHVEVATRIADIIGDAAVTYRGTQEAKRLNKEAFIRGRGIRVIVGNIAAFGIGTDGLQDVCSRAIFAEADWTPGINDQCIRRLWRSGQTRHVHVSFASLRGSIDEDIQRALARKAKITMRIKG